MPGIAYLDSSALLKLALFEAEASALESDALSREGLVTSTLAILECRRAARRHANKHALTRVNELLDALYLYAITPAILDRAAALDPPALRSLDAIHLATALAIGDPSLDLITYDDRLAAAARAHGLRVFRPGA